MHAKTAGAVVAEPVSDLREYGNLLVKGIRMRW
jgi:hypothetical protein